MPGDVQDTVRQLLINALEGGGRSSNGASESSGSNGSLSGMKGLAAGAGAAALAPMALKGVGRLARSLGVEGLEGFVKSPGETLNGVVSNLGDRAGGEIKDQLSNKLDEAGGPGGILKDTVKDALPFGGGGAKGGVPGVGKGRRMPVQQSVDIGLPIETVYNQFTQFEDWPNFMHRVARVTQEDDCTVSFATKIWGRTKEFNAEIETQRPNERIKWRVSQGMTHTGVVTFHELGPDLTRILLGFDVDPGSLIEKFARGARHIKRAARGDLHRFKAFIEMAEQETGAWRGVIEDGELVEEHDPSYDEQRHYADLEEISGERDSDDDEGKDKDKKRGGRSSQKAKGAQRQQSSRRSTRQRGDNGGSARSKSAKGSQSRRSAPTRASSGSSRGRSGKSRSGSSSSSSRSRSSRASSGGRSGSGTRGRSQSSKR